MAGIRTHLEDSDVSQQARAAVAVSTADLVSDDDRSIAADSWSIKSDYGSTLDDEQRHADAAEALSRSFSASLFVVLFFAAYTVLGFPEMGHVKNGYIWNEFRIGFVKYLLSNWLHCFCLEFSYNESDSIEEGGMGTIGLFDWCAIADFWIVNVGYLFFLTKNCLPIIIVLALYMYVYNDCHFGVYTDKFTISNCYLFQGKRVISIYHCYSLSD